MVESIKLLLEDYFNNTDQLNMLLKNHEKEQKKANKKYEQRQQFLIAILGKITYNKYVNNGTFAPIPLSALKINYNDIYFLNALNKKVSTEESYPIVSKFISELRTIYYRNELKLVDNGSSYEILTNIVFKNLDDIIDFFINIKKVYKKVYKTEENLDWKTFIQKFRNYLK